MSRGRELTLSDARAVADRLVRVLAPACDRIEVAGSIRRRKPLVHDIEIVAIPHIDRDVEGLWGTETAETDRLELLLAGLIVEEVLSVRPVETHRSDGSITFSTRYGPSYKALAYEGLPVDLFMTDTERWGCIFALRTGPHDWNIQLVIDCKRHWRAVADGRVLYHNRPLPTPEEQDFFAALGVPWVDPWDRAVDRLRFDPDLLQAVQA